MKNIQITKEQIKNFVSEEGKKTGKVISHKFPNRRQRKMNMKQNALMNKVSTYIKNKSVKIPQIHLQGGARTWPEYSPFININTSLG